MRRNEFSRPFQHFMSTDRNIGENSVLFSIDESHSLTARIIDSNHYLSRAAVVFAWLLTQQSRRKIASISSFGFGTGYILPPDIYLVRYLRYSCQTTYHLAMIKGILIINNHGKPRLIKFYQSVVSSTAHRI